MPATVISGAFDSNGATWNAVVGPGPFNGFCVVPNNTRVSQTFTGSSVVGTNAGDFAVVGSQFPVTVNPGQSVIFQLTFTPGALGFRGAAINFLTGGSFNPQVPVSGTQTVGVLPAKVFPDLNFPTTKVGQTSTFANAQLINLSSAMITVTAFPFSVGTDFFLIGAPVLPFNLASGASTPVFSLQFTPTVVNARTDFVSPTVTGGGSEPTTQLNGIGSVLQSAFNLTGGVQGSLFAFSAPTILLANPASLNAEEPGSFIKLHDFQQPNFEKMVARIRGHYEDLGPATVTFKLRSRRVGKPDDIILVSTPIGTAFADGWIREFTSEPTPVSGELVQITVSRAANSGPVSLIDYMPQWETKGEVVGGT